MRRFKFAVEEEPAADDDKLNDPKDDWLNHLKSILSALQAQLGTRVVLQGSPKVLNSYATPNFGYNIVGLLGFPDGIPEGLLKDVTDETLASPGIKFEAYISPDGKLMQPIEVFVDIIG